MSTTTAEAKAAFDATAAEVKAAIEAGRSAAYVTALTQTLEAQRRAHQAALALEHAERTQQTQQAAMKAAARKETMNQTRTAFAKALADLDAFNADASDGHFPSDYVKRRREELMTAARYADEEAIREHNANRAAKVKEARDLRLEAEARRDPQQRIADEMERTRLMLEKADPNDLIAKAEAMLGANQPERARFLLDTARALGGRPAHRVDRAIEDALDVVIPQRAKARELETDVQTEADDFLLTRYDSLAKSQIGIREDGSFGSGQGGEIASAEILKKAMAFRLQQAAAAANDGES